MAEKSKFLGHVYATRQGVFCLDPRDQFVARSLIETDEYGQNELANLNVFLTPASHVLLLGAHIGALAVPLSKCVASLTVFEANPDTYQLLKFNLAINQCANVIHYNLAANHAHGTLQFVMNTVNSGGSKRFPKHQLPAYFDDNPEIRTVPATRLDDLLFGKAYDLIFMDIEGSEYFAMRGMPQLIERSPVLVSEFLPHHLTQVAGISLQDYMDCLKDFKTMLVPTKRQVVHGQSEMYQVLHDMMLKGHGDMGLLFHKDDIAISFNA